MRNDAGAVTQMRQTDRGLPSLVDIAALMIGKNNNDAGKQVRVVMERHPEVQQKLPNLMFSGRGQRETPVGDVNAVVEAETSALIFSWVLRPAQFMQGELAIAQQNMRVATCPVRMV